MSSIPGDRFQVEGTQQEEVSIDSYDELQNACDYRLAFKGQGVNAVLCLFFGLLAFFDGVVSLSATYVAFILVVIGFLLVVVGLGVLLVRTPNVLLLSAIALWSLASWNIILSILDIVMGEEMTGYWIVFGIFQIAWGIRNFKTYRELSKIGTPPAGILKTVDDLVKDIVRAKARKREDIIEFQIANLRERQIWKGRLCDDIAILYEKRAHRALVVVRDDFEIKPHKETIGKGSWKSQFRLHDCVGKGAISVEHYDRYKRWMSLAEPRAEEPDEESLEAEPPDFNGGVVRAGDFPAQVE